MNAEELLIHIKGYLESLLKLSNMEILVLPTMYDPTKIQDDVSIIIMKDIIENKKVIGTIPKFRINIKDLETSKIM